LEGDDLDWDEALRAVKGDPALLQMVVAAALEESPRLLEQIRQAVADSDPAALRVAAHTLKGAIRYFGPGRAYEAAFQLETMGRDQDLAHAEEALVVLEGEIARLCPILVEYGRRQSADGS
jgi:HPt (histidine-containing phosphotransfer) domain-containing protein